jgi:hypothetical protein
MKPKSDWHHISREITVALSTNPHPNQTKTKRKVIPVVVRKSAIRTERAFLALGRLA